MRLVIPAAFVLLAAWFLVDPGTALPEPAPAAPVRDADIATTPLRPAPPDRTVIDVGGVGLRCSECHKLFESPPITHRTLNQHTHVVLEHGMNDRCLNCHAREDRNKLALHGGRLVGFDDAPLLCGKCHGPAYRDWEAGLHGRTNGYWDERAGEPRRLGCLECHDPHAPAFDGIAPLPGPRGWRHPGPGGEDGHADGETSPLRRWVDGDHDAPSTDETTTERHDDG